MRCTHVDKTFLVPLDHHQNIMSSTHELSLLSTSVFILDRSNYLVWKNQMRAWLRSKGLWQITNGNEKKFNELNPSTSSAACKANYKQCMDWDNKDDQAYGTILLRVNPSVAVLANSALTAKAIWEVLHAAFSTSGPSAIFADFKNAISRRSPWLTPLLTSWR